MKPKNQTTISIMLADNTVFPELSNPIPSGTRFGELLKRLMKERNITGQMLAESANVKPPSISRILSGENKPRTKTLHAIIKALARNPHEEEALMHAYHGVEISLPASTGKAESYKSPLRCDLEVTANLLVARRAQRADFLSQIEREAARWTSSLDRDFARNGACSDLLATLPDGTEVAIEAGVELHQETEISIAVAERLLARLGVSKVLIVTPYPISISLPLGLPPAIEIVPIQELEQNLAANLPDLER